MAKPRGRKPANDSKLPDPKVHKRCAHKGCDVNGFKPNAIFMENYCWNHLPQKRKMSYKRRLEAHVNGNHSLEEADLLQVKLKGAELVGANLKNANLIEVQLQDAKLWYADLRRADLVNANLKGADFVYAKLNGSRLEGVLWEGARYLTWKQIEIVGEEKIRDWESAQDAYLRLKNYFHQQGQYQDEAQAYYRERLMAQRTAWEEKKLGKWFVLFLLNILAGFGEKLWRTVVGAFATILIFSGIYWLAGKLVTNGGEPITKFWHCLYFSVVTFATMGFGDISPALHSTGTQVAAVIEVILGYVFLGMLITIIARKFGR